MTSFDCGTAGNEGYACLMIILPGSGSWFFTCIVSWAGALNPRWCPCSSGILSTAAFCAGRCCRSTASARPYCCMSRCRCTTSRWRCFREHGRGDRVRICGRRDHGKAVQGQILGLFRPPVSVPGADLPAILAVLGLSRADPRAGDPSAGRMDRGRAAVCRAGRGGYPADRSLCRRRGGIRAHGARSGQAARGTGRAARAGSGAAAASCPKARSCI